MLDSDRYFKEEQSDGGYMRLLQIEIYIFKKNRVIGVGFQICWLEKIFLKQCQLSQFYDDLEEEYFRKEWKRRF